MQVPTEILFRKCKNDVTVNIVVLSMFVWIANDCIIKKVCGIAVCVY